MTTAIAPITRKQSEWISPAELRTLLKSNLGYNQRQVTVSIGSSTKWLTITVRDPQVDIAKVKEFAATFDTMTCEMDDTYPGQSVNVETTGNVDKVHGRPFVEEIKATCAKLTDDRETGLRLSNGKTLWRKPGFGFYVTNGTERGSYVRIHEVLANTDWAIEALALQAARV